MRTVSRRPAPRPTAVPGEALLHPVGIAAMVILIVNDHVLKARWGTRPGVDIVTGKLSDVAGLLFFPLLLASVVEVARWAHRRARPRPPARATSQDGCCGGGPDAWTLRREELAVTVLVTGLGFAAVQTVPWAATAYSDAVAALRWLPTGLPALVAGRPGPPLPSIDHVMDVTDLLAVPALWWSWRIGRRVLDRRADQQGTVHSRDVVGATAATIAMDRPEGSGT